MTPQHSLTLGFAFLCALGVTALPSLGPTRTTLPHRTFVLTARAQSSSTSIAQKGTLGTAVDKAVMFFMVVSFLMLVSVLGYLVKNGSIQYHYKQAKKAWDERRRPKKPAFTYWSPPSSTILPWELQDAYAGGPATGNNPTCGELGGRALPTPPEEVPRQVVTGHVNPTVGKLDGHSEEPLPQSLSPSATPAHTDSTPVNSTSPPRSPEQPQNADSWKEGTVAGAVTEGQKP